MKPQKPSPKDYRAYEREKSAIKKDLTPKEYEQAVRKLANRMGV